MFHRQGLQGLVDPIVAAKLSICMAPLRHGAGSLLRVRAFSEWLVGPTCRLLACTRSKIRPARQLGGLKRPFVSLHLFLQGRDAHLYKARFSQGCVSTVISINFSVRFNIGSNDLMILEYICQASKHIARLCFSSA